MPLDIVGISHRTVDVLEDGEPVEATLLDFFCSLVCCEMFAARR